MTGFVYAALATDGILKVGQSWKPKSRLGAHSSAAKRRGAAIEGTWIWEHESASHAEMTLIQIAHHTGEPAWGREWFKNVDIDAFLLCADSFLIDKYGAAKTLEGRDFDAWLAAKHPSSSPQFKHIVAAERLGMSVEEYVSLYVSGTAKFCPVANETADDRFRCFRVANHDGDHNFEHRYHFFADKASA